MRDKMTVLRLTISPSAQALYDKIEAANAARRITQIGRATPKDLETLEGLARRADGNFTAQSMRAVKEVAYALEKGTPNYRGIDIIV